MRCIVWKNKTALLVVFCLLLCCCGCGQNKKETIHFFSMDTIMDITAYGDSGEALQLARDTIESLDAALNAADPQSAVSVLKDGDVLPKIISEPLETAQAIAAQTNGALDLTLYPLSDAWGFFTKEYRVPSAKEIRSLLQTCLVKYDRISHDFEWQEGTVCEVIHCGEAQYGTGACEVPEGACGQA